MNKPLPFSIAILLCLSISASIIFTGGKSRDTVPEIQGQGEVSGTSAMDIYASPAEIVFWWYGAEEIPLMANYIKAACDAYMGLHPNITVIPAHQSSENLEPNFLAAAEMQSGPDIATLGYGAMNMAQVWAGNVTPISDYVSAEEMSHWLGKGFSTSETRVRVPGIEVLDQNDMVWASDLYALGCVVLYNKNHFEDAGLDPNKPPETWDEFLYASEMLKRAGHRPFSADFERPGWISIYASCFFTQFLTFRDMVETVTGQRSFTDPVAMQAWEKIGNYSAAEYFIRQAPTMDFEASIQEWKRGNGSMCLATTQTAMMLLDGPGSGNIGIMRFPSLSGDPVYWVPAAPYSAFITRWSSHKELAADFLTFLHSEEIMISMIRILNSNVIPADDRFDMGFVRDPVKRQVFDWVHSGLKKEALIVDGAMPRSIVSDGLMPAVRLLITGNISPVEAAQKVEEAADKWRSLNPEKSENFKSWIRSTRK